MNPFLVLRGELRRSWGGALALALVLAFAGSLSPAVSMMERSIRSGMARAADSFDLLVGARGSSVDLVLGAVYLRPEVLFPAASGHAGGGEGSGRRTLGGPSGFRRPLAHLPHGRYLF